MLALVACGGIASLFIPSIWQRASEAFTNGGAGRLSIWSVGFRALKAHSLTGAGVGNFQDAYDRAYLSVFQSFNAHWHRPAHNLILGTAVELGVVGLIIMLSAWFAHYKTLDTVNKQSPYYNLAVGLQAALIGLFVACQFQDGIYEKYTWLAFAFIMLASARISHDSRESERIAAVVGSTSFNVELSPQTLARQDLVLRR
jgi:O-antigen ligase